MADMEKKVERIVKSVRDTAGALYEKADVQVEAAKIKYSINKRAEELGALYSELGMAIDKNRITFEGPFGDHVEMIYSLIDAKKEELDAARVKLDLLLGIARCEACGHEISAEMTFCPYCGAKQSETGYADEIKEEISEADDIDNMGDMGDM